VSTEIPDISERTAPATSTELLAAIREPWINFRLAAAAIGVERLETRSSSGWTYKEMLAHVSAWHGITARRLRQMRATNAPVDPPEIDDEDAFNARAAAAAKDRSVDDVLDELDRSAQALTAEIEPLTDEQVRANDGWAARIVAGNTYGHYAGHQAELMAAVPRTRRALEARVDEGWRRFRQLVETADLERTTSSGWSGKAVVAHAAHWLEHLEPELRRRLAGQRGPAPDVDAENAKSAADAEGMPAAQLVWRLDAAHGELLRTLASIPPDDEVPFLAIRAIAGETYDHFREHYRELAEIRR
jgi:hypothetical protein